MVVGTLFLELFFAATALEERCFEAAVGFFAAAVVLLDRLAILG